MPVFAGLPLALDRVVRRVGTELRIRRGRRAYLNDDPSVIADGSQDTADAINARLLSLASQGFTRVYCDGGSDYLITKTVNIPPFMRLEGAYSNISQGETAPKRAQFRAGASNISLMTLGSKASVSGVKFHLGRTAYSGNVGVFIDGKTLPLVENCLFGNGDETSTGIKGGAALYATFRRNIFSDSWFGRAIDFLDAHSALAGSVYYGINVGWIYENIFGGRAGCVRVEGTCHVYNNDFEGGAGYIGPAIEHSTASANGVITITGNYVEMSGGAMLGILLGSGSVARIRDNVLYAGYSAGVPVVGGYGVKAANYLSGATIEGNSFNRFETAIDLNVTSDSDGAIVVGENQYNNCTTGVIGAPVSGRDVGSSNTTVNRLKVWVLTREGAFVHRGAITGGAISWTDSHGLTLDLKRGNMFQLDMTTGGTLTHTNAAYGQRFTLYFKQANVTLQTATWRLASGQNEAPAAGKVKSFIVDYDGLVREYNP